LVGETDLDTLLRSLSPRLNDGRYVYAQVETGVPAGADPIVVVREAEGLTLVLAQQQGITLQVHSALDAIGLTAAVSRVLTDAGISANVVAGYTHDHVFVPHDRASDAMGALATLATTGR